MPACDRDVQYRRMDNSQNNGANASPAEEQVQRVEEAAAGSNPVEGNPSAGNMAPQAQTQTAQNIAQGDAATPLKTGVRQRGDTEKQRAAEVKVARAAALDKLNKERQQKRLRDDQEAHQMPTRRAATGANAICTDAIALSVLAHETHGAPGIFNGGRVPVTGRCTVVDGEHYVARGTHGLDVGQPERGLLERGGVMAQRRVPATAVDVNDAVAIAVIRLMNIEQQRQA